jgi:DNA polymerase-3 subunit epsilon
MTFVDVETTGGSYRRDRIIEIALIQTEDGKITSTFESLINPEQKVPDSILEMTGISQIELEKAPTFSEVVQEVGELLADSIFVAHNAAFDYGFVKNEFRILEKSYSAKCLCTVKLSRALYPAYRSHSLDSLIKRFNFRMENRHRAYDDAKVMVDFVDLVLKEFPQEKIEKAVNSILKRPSIPVGISEKKLKRQGSLEPCSKNLSL